MASGKVTATTCEEEAVDVDEETPAPVDAESVQNGLYTRLLNSYGSLLSIDEHSCGIFWNDHYQLITLHE